MKICPFVSHLLADDASGTLSIDGPTAQTSEEKTGADNVVVLGYEADDGPTDSRSSGKKAKGGKPVPSHLYCLKEACRFYKEKTGDCQFDLIFSMLNDRRAEAGDGKSSAIPKDFGKDLSKSISKDIDKIWKFQTKSVSELISSFADAEKSQSKSLAALQKELDNRIESLVSNIEKTMEKQSVEELHKNLTALEKKFDERRDGIEDLTATMSDIVVNVNESIRQLQEKSEAMHKQLEKLQDAFPAESTLKKIIGEAVASKVDQLKLPDFDKPLRELQTTLQDSLKKSGGSPEVEKKLQGALRSQQELESRLISWHDEILVKIQEIRGQQKTWTEQLAKLAEQQNELAGYLAEGKKHRETQRAETDKKEARKYNNLGVTSFHNGAYEMAKEQFTQAVKADPEFAEAYNNLGLAFTELNEEEKASEAFQKAVELNPALHAAYNNLGYIFFKQGNYDQAIEMYNEALGRSTNNSSAYTNLGNAYYKLGKLDDAYKAWEKALELDPSNEKAKKNLERVSEEIK